MSIFAGCMGAINMLSIKEVDCPKCGMTNSIEVFERDRTTVGKSVCEKCGYIIPAEVHLNKFLKEVRL